MCKMGVKRPWLSDWSWMSHLRRPKGIFKWMNYIGLVDAFFPLSPLTETNRMVYWQVYSRTGCYCCMSCFRAPLPHQSNWFHLSTLLLPREWTWPQVKSYNEGDSKHVMSLLKHGSHLLWIRNWVLHHFLISGCVTSRWQAGLLGHIRSVLFVIMTCQSMLCQVVIHHERPSLVEQCFFLLPSLLPECI